MCITAVRITITDGMDRKQVYQDTFSPADKTASIAAKELIDSSVSLRDGDTIEISFIDEAAEAEAKEERDWDRELELREQAHYRQLEGEEREREDRYAESY